jgi:hypothetical protein
MPNLEASPHPLVLLYWLAHAIVIRDPLSLTFVHKRKLSGSFGGDVWECSMIDTYINEVY